ncbi:hypothetical protein AB0F17_33930 [Nonomuraea sp. NPDC026600]|uniref:hypothetical protein n=1 Tax=Nonomuraea sp. NPDC026600 TaxID=3155363 RepID=UPI0033EEAE32
MSSRKFRGILAVATLTVAVSWMAAGPAAARSKLVQPAGDPSDRLSMAAARLADRLGVAGLATGHSVMNIADQGGMAATAGASTLPGGIPGTAGLADVSRLAEAPDLPTPRRLPRAGKLPVDMPDDATAAGSRIVGTVAESPVDPLQPVDQVERDTVASVLPEVPEHAPAIDGVNGLIQRLPLK